MGKCAVSVLFVVLVLVRLTYTSEFKLSDSKLLLPYHSFTPINYTLKGSNGSCYFWHSSTPEVAVVTPIDTDVSGCSTEAVVTAVWQSQHQAVTTIYARVSTTGQIVKCDVIVDAIHRIEIETTTQELYVRNTPEALTVVAFDEYGNTFSTLEGVPFVWHIQGDTLASSSTGLNVLSFLTWTESEYVTPKSIADLERKGLQGYMHLFSGLRTGSAVVRVSLMESVYRNVNAAQVRLLVLANAQLSPALAFLMPLSKLRLLIRVVQSGSDEIVEMPSAQYHLHVNDSAVLDLDPVDGCTVTARRYGQTEVTLFDRNVDEALLSLQTGADPDLSGEMVPHLPRRRLPTSLIHVIEPAYLTFTFRPQSTGQSDFCRTVSRAGVHQDDLPYSSRMWVMEVGQSYLVFPEIHGHSGHRLYPTDNLRLALKVPEAIVEILEHAVNGTWFVLRPVAPGSVSIEAKLLGLVDEVGKLVDASVQVTGSQDITIYPSIHVTPPIVRLPWPVSIATAYQLNVTGGTGHYNWFVVPDNTPTAHGESSEGVITLTPNGTVSALSYGTVTVVAASPTHPQLCGTVTVTVTEPAGLQFVPGPSEVMMTVGSKTRTRSPIATTVLMDHHPTLPGGDPTTLLVGLAVLDSSGQSMTDCRGLDISIQPQDSTILKVFPERLKPRTESPYSDSLSECLHVSVLGLDTGFTELLASFKFAHANPIDEASTDISTVLLDSQHGERSWTSRFAVAVYRDVMFFDPQSAVARVALGSTKTFLFAGGPQPWPLDGFGYFSVISPIPGNLTQDAAASEDSSTFPSVIHSPLPFTGQFASSATKDSPSAKHMREVVAIPDRKLRPMSFKLRCESLGAFAFRLELGNRPTKSNVAPITTHTQFKVLCVVPRTMQLRLHRPIPTAFEEDLSCPLLNSSFAASTDEPWIPNTVPSLISVTYFDSDGQRLDAVDSLVTQVSVLDSDRSTTTTTTTKRLSPSRLVAESAPKLYHPSDYAFPLEKQFPTAPASDSYFILSPIKPGLSAGQLVIQVNSHLPQSYASRVTAQQAQPGRLESEMSVRLSTAVQVLPDTPLHLFHLPKADFRISLHGGSGLFLLTQSTESGVDNLLDIREVDPPVPSRMGHADLRPISTQRDFLLSSNRVGFGRLRITDLCFPSVTETALGTHAPATVDRTVEVVGLQSLVLRVLDRVELSKQVVATVEAVDTVGSALPMEFFRSLELKVEQHPSSSGSVRSQSSATSSILGAPDTVIVESASPHSSAQFVVRGLMLGTASLSVSTVALQVGSTKVTVVRSNVVEIQVFAPLQLSPCNFDLLLGAEYELRAIGGPSPSSLEFALDPPVKSSRAELRVEQQQPTGVLVRAVGSPGPVTVRARSVSRSTTLRNTSLDATNSVSVISEATCTVNVVALSGIRIGCPLLSTSELVRSPASTAAEPLPGTDQSGGEEHFVIACAPDTPVPECSGTPLWIEGFPFTRESSHAKSCGSAGKLLSPMEMAGVRPALRFVWRFNPPQPPSVARLVHFLDKFNVDVDETHNAAGLILLSLSPGRVTIHVTVEATDPTKNQLIDHSGNRVPRLDAQLTVVILPPIGLQSPPIRIPHQLLMSPDSEYRLTVWNDVLRSSQVLYDFVNTSTDTSAASLVTISSNGVLRASRCHPELCSAMEKHATVRIQSWPSDESVSSKPQVRQTQLLDVVVKSPRYALITSREGNYARAKGLPVGGPYRLSVQFHDELGRVFDAVASKYRQLQIRQHRADLLQTQFLSGGGADACPSTGSGAPVCGSLMLHVLATERAAPPSSQPNTMLSVSSAATAADGPGFGPTFLTVPYGGELEGLGKVDVHVAQWICLPDLVAGAKWSSSDPSVIWVDSAHRLLLPRRAGKVNLLYTIPSASRRTGNMSHYSSGVDDDEPLSYSVRIVSSSSLPQQSDTGTVHLIRVDTNEESSTASRVTFLPMVSPYASSDPNLSSLTLRFLVQFGPLASRGVEDKSEQDLCPMLDAQSRKQLIAAAPIQCSTRFISSSETATGSTYRSRLVPSWLNTLLLWNGSEPMDSVIDLSAITLNQLITTRLEPVRPQSPFYHQSTQWQCVLQTTDLWPHVTPLLGLILPPNELIELQLRTAEPGANDSSHLLSAHPIVPLPGFQLLVPPALDKTAAAHTPGTSGHYHFWINDPARLTRQLLIFVPPSTATNMGSKDHGIDRIVARSKVPDVLVLTSSPRPVSSLAEVSQVLREYVDTVGSADSWWLGGSTWVSSRLKVWSTLASVQLQSLDNDAASAAADPDELVKRHLLWIVEVKAVVGDAAVDTDVEVMVSLRQTGQHVAVPVHVRLPSRPELIERGTYYHTTAGFTFHALGFQWIHLLALILITLLVAVLVHLMLRSSSLVSSSTGSQVLKNLPPTRSPSTVDSRQSSPRQLWSQSGYPSPQFVASNSPFSSPHGLSGGLTSPMNPHAGGDLDLSREEHKWRRALSGGSPSRLRDTFDSI